jgi:hypothetical protein
LSQPVQVEAVDPAPPDEFVVDQAGLPEHPEMAADGRPRDGKERRDLAGAEIAASQGGHDLSAGWVSDRREHIHDRKRNSAVTHLASDEAYRAPHICSG